jgi:hypothetical protein
MLKTLLYAAISLSALAPLEASAVALPLTSSPGPNSGSSPGIELVYGGCGPYAHRGPYGGCRPGGQFGGYIPGRGCPLGWHVGPYGRRCWPNR